MSRTKKLNTVERYYVLNHNHLSDEDLAQIMGISVPSIKRARKELLPAAAPTSFATSHGTVAMTSSQSMADDKALKDSPGPNKAFLQRYEKNIHVIDPSKPIQ